MADDRQRIDKWLWHARVVRTRTSAATLVSEGHVRLNGQRVTAPGQLVRNGDVLTITLDRTIRILRAIGFADKRASTAEGLWEDLSPPRPATEDREAPPAEREPGSGRPTKRERRATDRWRDDDF
ncbi:heat shock protein 15 [Variibacter gotjawalensis]|uniref:Heat shock protein 15 n=1 Tax=Variibacter gotjawalensis TaxID=1333996 RepID=A0A0S3PNY0_9BRAD|nr:S4 domain-containing protein [Variibacter gotjawalensis]NIK47948.1 ribosome-associated heat shock protein Hsp15 [Variibacter gotjawalensis]RZS49826.1 heat shock protein Hsp15 [Variibacter gotjawalensis]BAT57655.1 heat shock protein 15 [Variibacter gotjawalensis]